MKRVFDHFKLHYFYKLPNLEGFNGGCISESFQVMRDDPIKYLCDVCACDEKDLTFVGMAIEGSKVNHSLHAETDLLMSKAMEKLKSERLAIGLKND